MPNEQSSSVSTRPQRDTQQQRSRVSEISSLTQSQSSRYYDNFSPQNMETSSRNLILKILLDLVLLAIPAIVALLLYLFVSPFERGFFCNDESLIHPYKSDTISTLMLVIVGATIAISLILIVEIIRARRNVDARDKSKVIIFNRNVPVVIQKLYQYIGVLIFVMSINQFLTDMSKYAVGRLRPHFYNVCVPQMRDGTTCNDPQNHHQYIQNFVCTNQAAQWSLKNMRLSFPSGHSSFAFAVAIYCVLYIHARVTWRGSKLLKYFLQLIFIAGATYTGFSRVSDYKHHWEDVLAGSLLGISIALVLGIYLTDLFKPKRIVKEESNGHQV